MSSQPQAIETPAACSAFERDPTEEVIYAVSHDLRGPLLNFQGFLRRLRRSWDTFREQAEGWNLTPEQRETLRQIRSERIETSFQILEHNARRMEQLLQALLDLARAGREPVSWQTVSTNALLHRVGEQLRPVAVEKDVLLDIGPLPDLWAEPDRVEQIFLLALDNALKFLSPARPGRIRIGGSAEGTADLCWVEDNGIGIRPQDLERVFVPFGRVREIDGPGCGVGLATIRKLMRQMGGRTWIESTHHQGTTLLLAFPRRR